MTTTTLRDTVRELAPGAVEQFGETFTVTGLAVIVGGKIADRIGRPLTAAERADVLREFAAWDSEAE